VQYAVDLVNATRYPEKAGLKKLAPYIMFGASPRASISLVEGARALAFLRGRTYTTPQDLLDIAPDVMRHRVVMSYEALAENVTADDVISEVLRSVAAPERPLHRHVQLAQST